jgi:hypothetical protein
VAAEGLRARLAGFDLDAKGAARGPGGRLAPDRYRVALSRMLRHQLDPRPMVDLGVALAERGLATAAIDISDGLARDLHRLCRASGCGAAIDLDLRSTPSWRRWRSSSTSSLPAALYTAARTTGSSSRSRRVLRPGQRLSGRFALRRIRI